MQLLSVPFGLLFAIVVAAQDAGAPKELVIETTYAPPECSIKSQKGDVVKVHYVRILFFRMRTPPVGLNFPWQTGKLFSNGQKFDSRSAFAFFC